MYFNTKLSEALTDGLREKGYSSITVREREGYDPLTFVHSRCFVYTIDGCNYVRTSARINDPDDIEKYNEQYGCDYEVERYTVLLHEISSELALAYPQLLK